MKAGMGSQKISVALPWVLLVQVFFFLTVFFPSSLKNALGGRVVEKPKHFRLRRILLGILRPKPILALESAARQGRRFQRQNRFWTQNFPARNRLVGHRNQRWNLRLFTNFCGPQKP
jgi:hypothetical protein